LREYELTFIVQPEISDQGCDTLKGKLDGVLAQHGATRLLYDAWGKRKLAYEIQKFQKGHYFVLSFLDTGKAVPDLERTLRLEDSVLRFLTVVANENVKDVEARKARAAEEERLQAQRQAERLAREAEEAKARQEAEERARFEAEEAAAQRAEEPAPEGAEAGEAADPEISEAAQADAEEETQ
jgi:small subunit ribosomal protein S6